MTRQEHIDAIMDYFDFEKVHKVMAVLDWKWGNDDELHVPEIPELRRELRRLIKYTWDLAQERQEPTFCSTGGFEVIVSQHKEGINVTAKFVLEDFESDPNPDDTFTTNQ